jgi:hypothetical protein
MPAIVAHTTPHSAHHPNRHSERSRPTLSSRSLPACPGVFAGRTGRPAQRGISPRLDDACASNSREQTFPQASTTHRSNDTHRIKYLHSTYSMLYFPVFPRNPSSINASPYLRATLHIPFHRLTPLQSALTKSAPITLLESALTNPLDLKVFRIRTYRKPRGEGPKRLTTIQVAHALLPVLRRPRSQGAQQPIPDQPTRQGRLLRASTTHYSPLTAPQFHIHSLLK